jgi:predicted dehydrogenase
MKMGPTKILVIGCGSIGQRHSRLLSERPEVELYLADPAAENLQACREQARVRQAFREYREALQVGMDGAVICTPNALHVPMAQACLAAGVHVLLEKPVAPTALEAETLLEVRNGSGKQVAVGYVYRFDHLLRQVKAILERGELGTLVYANASIYTYRTLECAKVPEFRGNTPWVLLVDFTHDIDFLRYLAGDVVEVAAMSATLGHLRLSSRPNVAEILLRFASGAIGKVHMDYVRDPEKRSLEIVGDRSSIEFCMPAGVLKLFERGKEEPREIRYPYVRDNLFREQIANFLAVIEGKAAPLVNLEDSIKTLRIADAAVESCQTGRFVKMKD